MLEAGENNLAFVLLIVFFYERTEATSLANTLVLNVISCLSENIPHTSNAFDIMKMGEIHEFFSSAIEFSLTIRHA